MRNSALYFILVLLCATALKSVAENSVDSGVDVVEKSEDRMVIRLDEKIEKMVLNSMCDVVYKQSERGIVNLEGNLFVYTDGVKISNGTLNIGEGTNMVEKIEVYAPSISIFVLNGMGGLKCGSYTGSTLNVVVNGMGDADFTSVNAGDFTLSVNGTADFTCNSVNAKRIDINNNGMSTVRIKKLESQTLNATATGMGDIILHGIDVQRANLNSSGQATIEASGMAQNATYVLTGMGDIKARNLKARNVKKIDNREEWFRD